MSGLRSYIHSGFYRNAVNNQLNRSHSPLQRAISHYDAATTIPSITSDISRSADGWSFHLVVKLLFLSQQIIFISAFSHPLKKLVCKAFSSTSVSTDD